jgi:hypothetical protein
MKLIMFPSGAVGCKKVVNVWLSLKEERVAVQRIRITCFLPSDLRFKYPPLLGITQIYFHRSDGRIRYIHSAVTEGV